MSIYRAPLADMQFVMNELAGLSQVATLPGFEDATPDTVSAILEEAAKFATDVLDPLNATGDREGSTLLADGTVKTPAGFKEAYRRYAENGWNGLTKPTEYGGQNLPQLVATAVEEMWHAANMAFDLCPLLTQGAIEALDCANTELLRTGEIIRRLRDFMAKRDVELHVEDLAQVVHDAAALALVGQLHVAASYEIAPDAQMIIADRIQVQQVLVNVLRNAAEAVRDLPDERRAVSLSAHTIEGGLVEVTVADQGPGFPRKVLANLHAPFLSTKAGMGVGLAISRRIIEAHGGTLSARNGPATGAIVSFTLPLYERNREESE